VSVEPGQLYVSKRDEHTFVSFVVSVVSVGLDDDVHRLYVSSAHNRPASVIGKIPRGSLDVYYDLVPVTLG
jgi:hypothetical protein